MKRLILKRGEWKQSTTANGGRGQGHSGLLFKEAGEALTSQPAGERARGPAWAAGGDALMCSDFRCSCCLYT